MILFPPDTKESLRLTDNEIRVRDIMVEAFNPVLKFILADCNYTEWKTWGFNSCRQTAILGCGFLRMLLPTYDIRAYEGMFHENDGSSDYAHAFIIAKDKNHSILVDLSRTHKRLLFHVIDDPERIYPNTQEYSILTLLSKEEFDMNDMLYNSDMSEYITKQRPYELLMSIKAVVENLLIKSSQERHKFAKMMYEYYTTLKYE